jgi:hypothetical protein
MKQQLEFFATDAVAWRAAQQPGTQEKVLAQDADDPAALTRLVRWEPGLDTSRAGVITHDQPGIPHGPYRTPAGCTMLEIRYRATGR